MKLSKAYEPGQYEADIYALWEKGGVFQPTGQGEPYSIVMPPPNANANLHIGYELTAALEDIAARYHRLKGKSTLLLPGADHAGFETQAVYEKHLQKQGKSRFDFSREELYKDIWDFVADNRDNFQNQMRRMGIGCDWTRFTFTLDKKITGRAYATFKKMWDEGLIYRGERLVNFCTFHGTAFADIEVEYKEESGHLWHLRYPLTDGTGEIIVATTRPETMLGDTAVAVNPRDTRYTKFVGKTVKLPLTDREIPIIADDFVNVDFGSGAVKITPAHDPNDFDAGKRHSLPMLSVINFEGIMENVPEKYQGLEVKAARKQIVQDLEGQGALEKTQNYSHSVGHCYKCGTIIQPLLKDQWFVDMQPLAKPAIKALEQDRVTFYPSAKRDQLKTYLENLKDWNISRQIAWGIPIPAFQNVDDPTDWIYDERVDQAVIEVDGKTYQRDPDVFDTWFSSSSWPYATLNYSPEEENGGKDFDRFYPLSLMETGGEILYPWVSRMLMLGLYVTGEIPFKAVYIHGYVMAEDGSKMSKSIGNVVNPLPVIDQFGSDALRLGIIQGRAPAVNRGYDPRKIEDGRNFCNKLWNIARYVEGKVGDGEPQGNVIPENIADHWIMTKLQQTTEVISEYLEAYRFNEAYETLYHFVWDDFADWYVEASKIQPNVDILAFGLEAILKLAHPFAPFVTETIWQTLEWSQNSILAQSSWPMVTAGEKLQAETFERVQAIVSEARFISLTLSANKPRLCYSVDEPILEEQGELIARLAKLSAVSRVGSHETTQTGGVRLTRSGVEAWLDIDAQTAHKYLTELESKQQTLTKSLAQLDARLGNESYIKNAPETIVSQTHEQRATVQAQLDEVLAEHERFSQLG